MIARAQTLCCPFSSATVDVFFTNLEQVGGPKKPARGVMVNIRVGKNIQKEMSFEWPFEAEDLVLISSELLPITRCARAARVDISAAARSFGVWGDGILQGVSVDKSDG